MNTHMYSISQSQLFRTKTFIYRMHCSAVLSLARSPEGVFQDEILSAFAIRQVQHLPFAHVRGQQDSKLSTIKITASFAYLLYCMFLIKRDSYRFSDRSQNSN